MENKIKICIAIIGICIYRFLLDWSYINVITHTYGYYGFIDMRTSMNFLISLGCLLISFPFLLGMIKNISIRVSTIVIWILYLISYVPFTSCIYMGIAKTNFVIGNIIYWLLILIMQNCILTRKIKKYLKIRYNYIYIQDKVVEIIGTISMLLVIYISWKYTGFRLISDLFSVYEYRSEFLTYDFPLIITYAFSWTKAINPILMVYFFCNNKKVFSVCFFISQLFAFGIDGLKATLFMVFLGILIILFYKNILEKNLIIFAMLGVVGVTLSGVVEKIILNTEYIIEFIIRRIMFLPNLIGNYYFEFFTKYEPDYFRSSFLKYFGVTSPYTVHGESIGQIIGRKYIIEGMNCNNGLSSDAITNLGSIGIFIMPFFIIGLLYVLDCSTIGLDKRVVIMASLYVTITLLSSFLFTILLTHGILVMILMLMLVSRKKHRNEM